MQKPNVLILMCDQMQARRMGFVDGIAHTPNLDALAVEGVHFPNAITVHGQCVPSRCAFATGMSPHECNVMANFGFRDHCGHLTTRNRTFFQEFQDHGYTTAHFGKSHLGFPLRSLGVGVGECLDGNFPPGKEPTERIRAREENLAAGGDGYAAQSPDQSCHYKFLDEGLEWLGGYQPDDGPLLFMYDTNLPHPPFHWEEEWQDQFTPEDMVLPNSFYGETFDGKPDYMRERASKGYDTEEGEQQLRTDMAQYYTLIAAVDKACGRIIDQFKAKGMWGNTIVLFLSDHGDMMGGHKLRFKGNYPYEELYNIPCILKLPAGEERTRTVVEEPIISTDLPGALLDLAGIDAGGAFSGSAVTAAFNREAPTGDEQVFFEHYAAWWGRHPFYGVRTATMKYVRYYGEDDFEELYDLEKDPDELVNVLNQSDYAQSQAELCKAADDWWQTTGGQSADYYETDEFKAGMN